VNKPDPPLPNEQRHTGPPNQESFSGAPPDWGPQHDTRLLSQPPAVTPTAGLEGTADAIERSSFAVRDLIREMTAALTARPARTFLTALGTILGVAALVATLGLAKTAGNRIVSRFNELEATQVVIVPFQDQGMFSNQNQPQVSVLPWDATDRLERLNGVIAAGTITDVDVGSRLARSVPVVDPLAQTEFQIPVIAADQGLFAAARSQLGTGRFFDIGHEQRADPVAVLGPAAAQRLNVSRVDNTPSIFIGDESFIVIGLLADTARKPELLNAIIIPKTVARERFGTKALGEVLVDVEVGAAELIGTQAATALYPNDPSRLRVSVPPSPRRVRSNVESDINSLFLVLGGVSLLVGGIGIANVTLVSVLERTGEIGLRRALGASRSHIAVQFLAESVGLGALAGLVGTSVGVLTVVAVSANRQWSPVLDPWLPLAAPALGAVIGLLAGTYPAWKASKTEPIAALRGTA